MNLEEEARTFSSIKRVTRDIPRLRGLNLSLVQVKETIYKLKEVREGMRIDKICTSDVERAKTIQLAIDDVDVKIADYEQQLSIMTEKQNGSRKGKYHITR